MNYGKGLGKTFYSLEKEIDLNSSSVLSSANSKEDINQTTLALKIAKYTKKIRKLKKKREMLLKQQYLGNLEDKMDLMIGKLNSIVGMIVGKGILDI